MGSHSGVENLPLVSEGPNANLFDEILDQVITPGRNGRLLLLR